MNDVQNMNDIGEVTALTFDSEVLRAERPVLVEFYSPWCGSCRKMEPILGQLTAEFEGRIKFARVDVDSDLHLADVHNIGSVPTLLLFKDGRALHRVVGQVSLGWLEAVLGKVAEAPGTYTEAAAIG